MLTVEGKVAVLVDQLRQLGISIFIEEVNLQYLKTRAMAGKPEYAKALAMTEGNLRELQRKKDWYEQKLAENVKEMNEQAKA